MYGKMYWAEWGTQKIQRANLDGSSVQDLVTTGLASPAGIALWSAPVGGIAEYPPLERDAAVHSSGGSLPLGVVLGIAAGGALLLAAGGWGVRRRQAG